MASTPLAKNLSLIFEVKTLDGTVIDTNEVIKEIVAPAIYSRTKDLALVDVALKLYNAEPVEVTAENIQKIKDIFSEDIGIAAFVRKAILDALDNELAIFGK